MQACSTGRPRPRHAGGAAPGPQPADQLWATQSRAAWGTARNEHRVPPVTCCQPQHTGCVPELQVRDEGLGLGVVLGLELQALGVEARQVGSLCPRLRQKICMMLSR